MGSVGGSVLFLYTRKERDMEGGGERELALFERGP